MSKARVRLDHNIAKLGKARARNVQNEPDFCPKFFKKSSDSVRSKFGLGSAPISESKARLELTRSHSQKARARSAREIRGSCQH